MYKMLSFLSLISLVCLVFRNEERVVFIAIMLSSLFIHYASFPRQNFLGFASNDPFALGLIFVDHCPQELIDIFPYSENVQPLYQHKKAIWGPCNTEIKFEPWPIPKSLVHLGGQNVYRFKR